jgi:D-alanine-D-alanine ligase
VRPLNISILYDACEDDERAKQLEAEGKAPPLICEVLGQVLAPLGHNVKTLKARSAPELTRLLSEDESELVFNVCEGFAGVGHHEQHVAALLELMGKRFTGAGSIGLALAGDKALAKKLLAFHGINTPRFSVIHSGQVDHADDLSFPMFVKPSNADASIGIDQHSVVHNFKELMERIGYIETEFHAPALIEEFIDGREIYVSVLQGERLEALPIVEWDFSKLPPGTARIASAEAKWDENSPVFRDAKEGIARDLPDFVELALKEAALEAFRSLKLRDYGRIDMRLRRRKTPSSEAELAALKTDAARQAAHAGWELFIIEVNPNPHLATDSEFPMAARAAGLAYPETIERILTSALTRELR